MSRCLIACRIETRSNCDVPSQPSRSIGMVTRSMPFQVSVTIGPGALDLAVDDHPPALIAAGRAATFSAAVSNPP